MTTANLKALMTRLRPQLSKLLLVAFGFLLGGLLMPRSCSAPEPHENPDQHAESAASSDTNAIWTCAMHPQIRQSEPGQCPLCGMDLIPVADSFDRDDAPDRVMLSDRARALAKLRTTPVQPRLEAAAELRLLGRIEANETTLRTITAWTGGRIDRLHVNVTGQRVRAGQVIATLYSPEVFSAHQDLLVAKGQVEHMAQSPPSSQSAARATLEAARQRLRLLGVPDDELARMETRKSPTQAVPIRTPFSGTIIERMASEGAYVVTGAPLYRTANLRTVWVQLDAYESDLARVSVGQSVTLNVKALPGETFDGKVTFIDPTLDATLRTAKVRVEIDNRDRRLRPGLFAEATVLANAASDERAPLVVPASAPLFTGQRALVYVEVQQGDSTAYEARPVRLGPRLGDFYPVVAGLSLGERVVSRGAFALDADLQIRGGASMMTQPDDREPEAEHVAFDLPASTRKRLAPIVALYLDVQRALAEDTLPAAQKAASALDKAVAGTQLETPSEAVAVWPELAQTLRNHANHVARADDLEGARAGFEGLSQGVTLLLRRLGNPLDKPLSLAFCPMAQGNQGASWIQEGTTIDNAYFGASMRSCGEVQQQVAPGSHLTPSDEASSPSTAVAPSAKKTPPTAGHLH